MSFSTTPKANANVIVPPTAKGAPQSSQPSARERAINALLTPNTPAQAAAQGQPVPNATNISPEEMGAIAPKAEQNGQSNISDGTPSAEGEPSKEVTKTKEESPLSQQYTMLARKERALRAKVQAQDAAFKAQDVALKAREDAIKAKEAEYQSNYISKDRIAKDPFMTLQELGISYDQLTEQALNQPQTDPATRLAIQKLEQKLEAQAKLIEDAKLDSQKQQKDAYQQAVSQIRTETKQLVISNPDFETIRETGSVNDVVDLIEQTFNKDGILLSVEDACREVEEYLVEETMKLAKLKKIQQRLAPKQAPAQQAPQAENKQQPAKTLTNAVTSSKRMSARDRAIAAMEGKLIK